VLRENFPNEVDHHDDYCISSKCPGAPKRRRKLRAIARHRYIEHTMSIHLARCQTNAASPQPSTVECSAGGEEPCFRLSVAHVIESSSRHMQIEVLPSSPLPTIMF
jgi:hypothetical protein